MWKSAKHKIIFEKLLNSQRLTEAKSHLQLTQLNCILFPYFLKCPLKKKKFLIQYLFVKTFVQQS